MALEDGVLLIGKLNESLVRMTVCGNEVPLVNTLEGLATSGTKYRARRYWIRDTFQFAILFCGGGLDMNP
jgi:hypothetical protein